MSRMERNKNRRQGIFASRKARIAGFVAFLAIVMVIAGALAHPSGQDERDPAVSLRDGATSADGGSQQPLDAEVSTRVTAPVEPDTGGTGPGGPGTPASGAGGQGPSAGGTPPAGGTPSAADPMWNTPVADVSVLLPTSIEGLSIGSITQDEIAAVVPFDPVRGGPYSASMRRVLLSVRDAGSAEVAAKHRAQVSQVVFSSNASDVTVHGVRGYFGTDGARLATVSFTRGRFVFEVVVTATGDPAGVRDAAVRIASAFPTEVAR